MGPRDEIDDPRRTAHHAWRSFAAWDGSGTAVGADGRLEPAGVGVGVGEAVSPEVSTGFTEAIASWTADTPAGSWIETYLRARVAGRWTAWYSLGAWASGESSARRRSAGRQEDADGSVEVDMLVLAAPADGFRAKLRLFTANGAAPAVRSLSVSTSTSAGGAAHLPSSGVAAGTLLPVPGYSQMVYPDGGDGWCSPTSVSMVLAHWNGDPGTIEERVRRTVAGVYDPGSDGHGNWPFNTAFAATEGMEATVARFTSLNDVEAWLAAGVPVVFSWAWRQGEIAGAATPSSDGHLAVIVGFDAAGNPIVNDPAAATDEDVRRTYDRTELETAWLEASGGTVYLIHPPGHPVPEL